MTRAAESGYRSDLAYIHDDGFGGVAREAAAFLRASLRRRSMTSGTIVDLGCGSGILARGMTDAGYEPRRVYTEGDGWAVLMTAEENPRQKLLTRRITTFRRTGKLYRRTEEVHRLRLIPRNEIDLELRDAGFRVRALRTYGSKPFLPGVTGYLAEKRRSRDAAR